MKRTLSVLICAALVGAAGGAQPWIASLDPGGELTWTNSFSRGLYRVESAASPVGPWNLFGDVVDSDPSETNRIKAQISPTHGQAFHRVAWMPPNPVGMWDYRGYDSQGTLVVTGALNITSISLSASNAANPVYTFAGDWRLDYAGPPTNRFGWLGPQLGSGSFAGALNVGAASLDLMWPINTPDDNIQLFSDIWGNTVTGSWFHWPLDLGPFTAVRTGVTNFNNSNPPTKRTSAARFSPQRQRLRPF